MGLSTSKTQVKKGKLKIKIYGKNIQITLGQSSPLVQFENMIHNPEKSEKNIIENWVYRYTVTDNYGKNYKIEIKVIDGLFPSEPQIAYIKTNN